MSARHAIPRPECGVADPVGLVLGCVWALGTAAGFTCLGVLVGDSTHVRGQVVVLSSPDSAHPAT